MLRHSASGWLPALGSRRDGTQKPTRWLLIRYTGARHITFKNMVQEHLHARQRCSARLIRRPSACVIGVHLSSASLKDPAKESGGAEGIVLMRVSLAVAVPPTRDRYCAQTNQRRCRGLCMMRSTAWRLKGRALRQGDGSSTIRYVHACRMHYRWREDLCNWWDQGIAKR